MKKLVLIPTFLILAACGACTNTYSSAHDTCVERGYTKGSSRYDHCMVDERRAEKLENETKARMK